MDSLGQIGESIAAKYLESLGWTIITRNWRCSAGEVDLIAYDPTDSATVFVEVKTRSGTGYGEPLEAVNQRKVAKLRQLVGQFLHEELPDRRHVRIDAIGVLRTRGFAPQIDHRRGIG